MSIAVVGAGPAGIFTATLLASTGKSVTLFQKGEIGGSHRVDWVSGSFSEHGPRVYADFYVNYRNILKHLDIDFYEFHSQPFSPVIAYAGILTRFSIRELLIFIYYFWACVLFPTYYKSQNLLEITSSFSEEAKTFLRKFSNLLGNDSYNAWSFFAAIDNVTFKAYTASKPYSELWAKVIAKFEAFGGQVVPENVEKIIDFGVQTTGGTNWYFEKVILCTPPKATFSIMSNSLHDIKDAIMPIDDLAQYAQLNSYPHWVSCSIIFDEQIQTSKEDTIRLAGLDGSEWAIIASVSNIKFKGTVITACTMELDKPADNGLVANDITSEDQLLQEMSRQVCAKFKINKKPSKLILNPKVSRLDGKWITSDVPYVQSYQIPQEIKPETQMKGLFWVGAHNGESKLGVNTMEATCENVIKFCRRKSNLKIRIGHRIRWSEVFLAFLVLVLVFKMTRHFQ